MVKMMLELRNVSHYYRGVTGNVQSLHDISLKLYPGEMVGLFGENGAGKTTLEKCILGLLSCSGEILLDGRPVTRQDMDRFAFATCEHSFFPNLNPGQHAELYKMHFSRFREKRFYALMNFFELSMHKPLKAFSTGQKNQFEVILALCQGAEFILMDEPFAGNDVFNREDFYKVLVGILEPTETVVISTHLIEEVQNCISRAVLIRKGRIVGDVTTLKLEEDGMSLMSYMKKTYHYRSDRVGKALEELSGGDAS